MFLGIQLEKPEIEHSEKAAKFRGKKEPETTKMRDFS